MRITWALIASAFASFDINVTTVDPAVAAGQAATDQQRINYYDSQVGTVHVIIAPNSPLGWSFGASGLALGYAGQDVSGSNGNHTAWMFADGAITDPLGSAAYFGPAATHEIGHSLGLSHQDDTVGGGYGGGYGLGDTYDADPDCPATKPTSTAAPAIMACSWATP